MIKLFGIPNCDTIKKAKKWLEQNNIEYTFHDYRKDGVNSEMVNNFCQQLDWQQVLNKRGTTYRQLDDATKENLNAESAVALLVEQPAMIKRPILEKNGEFHLGFKADQYQSIFS
ncbi:MAG: ArsC family reductase [Pseudoalteromonas spongiae]|uniref:ArsC family reductase n=1 Tax=Pseudoalteromonas spongiae TaxID=298657 RepID=A0ABU8EQL5_9GAMM|nr:ArsC family reductase [Pseudoalteromonas spongiae]ATC98493.1 arsenate reductase [Pseudoalteromonas spongiae UST010723-006]MEC8324995.1 ArsC family reductase [Pseudomonadota bacterium]TMO87991.1 ArsC family reductase [Pseudoalteromonas spongiae]